MESIGVWSRVKEWLEPESPYPEIDEYVYCPDPSCTRRMLFRDVFEHFFITHLNLREKLRGSQDSTSQRESNTNTERDSVSRGELVDDYNPDWLEEKREQEAGQQVVIQEASGSGSSGRTENLKRYYHIIWEKIEEEGEFRITENTHIGNLRGGHIKQEFKSAVRRVEDDCLENYEISNDGTGDYPVVISRSS